MLVTFKSKVSAEVLMLSQHALPLLNAAGKQLTTVPERGVFSKDQLAAAIEGLEKAVAAADPVPHDDNDDDLDRDEPPVHPISRPVGLDQRAYPVIDMLRKALAAGESVMWETSRGY